MRIIAGRFGGRRLQAPKGRHTRPTTDRVREALFSALGPLDGLRVADLFAGSGALGIEALSRGAVSVDFYERWRPAVATLRANLRALNTPLATQVVTTPLPRGLAEGPPWDLVLVDPPWREGRAAPVVERVLALGRLAARGRVVVEEASGAEPDAAIWEALGLAVAHVRRYGDTSLTFLVPARGADEEDPT